MINAQHHETTNPREAGVYTTHEKEKLLCVRAMVDGQESAAYIKEGKLIGYVPTAELIRQLCTGPYLVFSTH